MRRFKFSWSSLLLSRTNDDVGLFLFNDYPNPSLFAQERAGTKAACAAMADGI